MMGKNKKTPIPKEGEAEQKRDYGKEDESNG